MTERDPVSPVAAGLSCRCPRCGRGALYGSFLGLLPACRLCGLDYAAADAGDGPAVFVIFIAGFVGVLLAFVLRFSAGLSIAGAFAVSATLSLLVILALLRPLKATLIALQYRHKAHESRLDEAS